MLEFKDEPQKRYLRCPHCKSDDLAFVAEYHTAFFLRLWEGICVIWLVIFSISELKNFLTTGNIDTALIILPCIAYIVFHAIRTIKESKTHVQAICRVCGEIWLLN